MSSLHTEETKTFFFCFLEENISLRKRAVQSWCFPSSTTKPGLINRRRKGWGSGSVAFRAGNLRQFQEEKQTDSNMNSHFSKLFDQDLHKKCIVRNMIMFFSLLQKYPTKYFNRALCTSPNNLNISKHNHNYSNQYLSHSRLWSTLS